MGDLAKFVSELPARRALNEAERERLEKLAEYLRDAEPDASEAFQRMADGDWLPAARAWRRVLRRGPTLASLAREMIPFCRRHWTRALRESNVLPFACRLPRQRATDADDCGSA